MAQLAGLVLCGEMRWDLRYVYTTVKTFMPWGVGQEARRVPKERGVHSLKHMLYLCTCPVLPRWTHVSGRKDQVQSVRPGQG